MSQALFLTSFPWERYSEKLVKRILHPRCGGAFTPEDAIFREMHFAQGNGGKMEDGNYVSVYWLVDPADGIIADAKFQVFGQSALIGAAEAACEIIIGKNYDQAQRVGADLIDRHLRDKADHPAFPKETYPHIHLVVEALEGAGRQCGGMPLPSTYVAPPMPTDVQEGGGDGFPGWLELPQEKKLAVVEEVLNRDIRPYIALDAGGVEVTKLENQIELHIAYKGSCTSCMSSVGATLSYIQQTLRHKVHPSLVVVPDLGG